MTRFTLEANPAAGSGNEPEDVRRALAAAGGEEAEPAERYVAAGGDGTIAPAAQRAGELGIPLAVIPTGTANDFARAFDLPLEVEAAAALAVTGARTEPVELGFLNGETPFVNGCNAGLPVLAARWARALKGRLGPLAYAVGAVRAGLTAKPVPCEITCDDEPAFHGRAWQINVACTGHFGGGSAIGETEPSDGELDVAIVEAGPRWRLVRYAFAMKAGRLTSDRDVRHVRAKRVEVRGDLAFNQDGELHEPHASGRATFTARASAFELVVPEPTAAG